jgi:hypothetical protein
MQDEECVIIGEELMPPAELQAAHGVHAQRNAHAAMYRLSDSSPSVCVGTFKCEDAAQLAFNCADLAVCGPHHIPARQTSLLTPSAEQLATASIILGQPLHPATLEQLKSRRAPMLAAHATAAAAASGGMQPAGATNQPPAAPTPQRQPAAALHIPPAASAALGVADAEVTVVASPTPATGPCKRQLAPEHDQSAPQRQRLAPAAEVPLGDAQQQAGAAAGAAAAAGAVAAAVAAAAPASLRGPQQATAAAAATGVAAGTLQQAAAAAAAAPPPPTAAAAAPPTTLRGPQHPASSVPAQYHGPKPVSATQFAVWYRHPQEAFSRQLSVVPTLAEAQRLFLAMDANHCRQAAAQADAAGISDGERVSAALLHGISQVFQPGHASGAASQRQPRRARQPAAKQVRRQPHLCLLPAADCLPCCTTSCWCPSRCIWGAGRGSWLPHSAWHVCRCMQRSWPIAFACRPATSAPAPLAPPRCAGSRAHPQECGPGGSGDVRGVVQPGGKRLDCSRTPSLQAGMQAADRARIAVKGRTRAAQQYLNHMLSDYQGQHIPDLTSEGGALGGRGGGAGSREGCWRQGGLRIMPPAARPRCSRAQLLRSSHRNACHG